MLFLEQPIDGSRESVVSIVSLKLGPRNKWKEERRKFAKFSVYRLLSEVLIQIKKFRKFEIKQQYGHNTVKGAHQELY